MNLNKKKIQSILYRASSLFVFLMLYITTVLGQNAGVENTYYLAFKQEKSENILSVLSDTLNVSFNYSEAELPVRQFSFSVSGTSLEIIDRVFKILEKPYVFLEASVVAIQPGINLDELIEPDIIEGRLLDVSGMGLPYGTITIAATKQYFQTDADGYFRIIGHFAESETVRFSYIGYGEEKRRWSSLQNQSMIILSQNENLLGEVVIRDYLRINSSNDILNTQRLRGDLINVAGMGDNDLLATAQVLPGVYTTSESLSDLQIRGGPPDQVDYKWNGIKLLQSSLFYGKISGVNPFLVDELSITRDGASADQSGQASGSIIMKNNQGVNNELGIKLYSDLMYTNVGLSMPIVEDRISAQFAFRGSHTQLFRSNLFDAYFDQIFQFGQLQNDQFYIDFFGVRGQERIDQQFKFRDFSGTIDFKVSDKTDLKISYLQLGNSFSYDYYDGLFNHFTKRDQLELKNTGASAILLHRFTDHLKLSANVTGSFYNNTYHFYENINTQNSSTDRYINNNVDQYQANAQLTYTQEHYKINFGVQHEHWGVTFADTTYTPGAGLYQTVLKNKSNEQSAFITGVWKWVPGLTLETGMRYSDFAYSLVDRKFYEPRLHASYRWSDHFMTHIHYGKYHQNLNRRLFSNPLEIEKGTWFVSDERPEAPNFIWVVQNNQSSIGMVYTHGNWKFTSDFYRKRAENIWTSALDFSNTEDPYAFADLEVKGMEFSGLYQNGWLRLLWTYELVDEDMYVKAIDPFTVKSPFTQRHKISLLQNFYINQWEVSTRWRYSSGRYFSEGDFLDTYTNEDQEEIYQINYKGLLDSKIQDFHTLDLSLSYRLKPKKWKKAFLKCSFHCFNLYNRRNIVKRQFFIDYTKTPFEMSAYDRLAIPRTYNLSLAFTY